MAATVSLARLASEEGRRNPFRYYAWLHGALARLEAVTAFRRLAAFPQLRLAAPPPPRNSLSLRGYDQLLVHPGAG